MFTAIEKMKNIEANVEHLHALYQNLQYEFSLSDIKNLRRKENLSSNFWVIFRNNCIQFAEVLRVQSKKAPKPSLKQIPFTYNFRLSVFINIHFLLWIENGSQSNVSYKKWANDMIDLEIGALSSFFDGLITNDNKLNTITSHANTILIKMGIKNENPLNK